MPDVNQSEFFSKIYLLAGGVSFYALIVSAKRLMRKSDGHIQGLNLVLH